MKKLLAFLKCFIGVGSVADGSICWFSCKFYDIHDYHQNKGGDGIPSHFYRYRCWRCGKEFTI